MNKSYRMVKNLGEDFFIEKKSKFISYVAPVYSEEEAFQFINSIKKKHYDATHNCYAYILGELSNIQRSSDDGEPSGTAGIPILEVIRKEELTNTVIVVTRYFGGIMLGAGGLIRAYTEGAVKGIKVAGTVKVQPTAIYCLSTDYSYLSKLQYEIPRKQYTIASTEYLDIVNIKILIKPEDENNLQNDIAQWTNGTAIVKFEGIQMMKIDESI